MQTFTKVTIFEEFNKPLDVIPARYLNDGISCNCDYKFDKMDCDGCCRNKPNRENGEP